jgi:hypothetical protein
MTDQGALTDVDFGQPCTATDAFVDLVRVCRNGSHHERLSRYQATVSAMPV